MRPALKSGLLPVWRDRDTLQIGIDPRRAIALSGMGRAAFVIGLLDGSRDRDQVIATAARRGIPVQATERILTLLAAGGALDDFPASTYRELTSPLRAKLAAELATTSLAHRDGDGGARALARRRAALVRIEGDQRIGRAVARIVSASGIGQVQFVRLRPGDPPGDPSDGGPCTDATGRSATSPIRHGPVSATGRSGRGESRRPGTNETGRPDIDTGRTGRPGAGQTRRSRTSSARRSGTDVAKLARIGPSSRPDLVILVGRQPQEVPAQLARERIPHLAVAAGEAIGIVGPLVIPGKTACLRCLDYTRAGNDPAWPLILAQLRRRKPDPPACDAVLAAAVAAQAAAQAVTAIETAPIASAAFNGTLELVLPDWQWRRRTWAPHPACLCGSHTAT